MGLQGPKELRGRNTGSQGVKGWAYSVPRGVGWNGVILAINLYYLILFMTCCQHVLTHTSEDSGRAKGEVRK